MASAPELDSTPSGDESLPKFSSVEKLQVFDGEGEAVEFGGLYRDQKTVVIFIRVSIIQS